MTRFWLYLASQYRHLLTLLMKFASVGLLGFVVDSFLYFVLGYLGMSHLVARFISYWVTATHNWFLNRIFTFTYADKHPKFRQWAKYLGVALGSFVLNWSTYYGLTEYTRLLQDAKYVAFICGVGAGFVFNFAMANLVVFKKAKTPSQLSNNSP